MTTFAPRRADAARLLELDELVMQAWADYRHELRDLEGREYEDAEQLAWELLQRKLGQLERERAEVVESAIDSAAEPA